MNYFFKAIEVAFKAELVQQILYLEGRFCQQDFLSFFQGIFVSTSQVIFTWPYVNFIIFSYSDLYFKNFLSKFHKDKGLFIRGREMRPKKMKLSQSLSTSLFCDGCSYNGFLSYISCDETLIETLTRVDLLFTV